MKGILTITVVLAMFSVTGLAQNSVKNLGASDPDAKKVLDGVTAKFKTYATVKADFVLQIENAAGKIQGTKKGTAYMKSNQYKVELTEQEIFCNAQKIWTYDKSANEVQVSKFDPSGSSFTPQKIFTNFYEKDFLYKLNGEKKEGKKTNKGKGMQRSKMAHSIKRSTQKPQKSYRCNSRRNRYRQNDTRIHH